MFIEVVEDSTKVYYNLEMATKITPIEDHVWVNIGKELFCVNGEGMKAIMKYVENNSLNTSKYVRGSKG